MPWPPNVSVDGMNIEIISNTFVLSKEEASEQKYGPNFKKLTWTTDTYRWHKKEATDYFFSYTLTCTS